MTALSQMTENRKVEARKPLIFQDTVFEFYLEKATLRQSLQNNVMTLRAGETFVGVIERGKGHYIFIAHDATDSTNDE